MKWRGISFKLFAVTSLVFISCLAAMMLLQLTFFEPYYVRDKTGGLIRDFQENRQRFLQETPDANTVPIYFAELEEQYYAVTAILTISQDENWLISAGKGIAGDKVFIRINKPAASNSLIPGGPSSRFPGSIKTPFPNVELDKLMTGLDQWYQNLEKREAVLLC
jgi:hypothetical protein